MYPTTGQECDFCDRPHGDVFLIRDRYEKARKACVGCIEAVLLKVISLLAISYALLPVLNLA